MLAHLEEVLERQLALEANADEVLGEEERDDIVPLALVHGDAGLRSACARAAREEGAHG